MKLRLLIGAGFLLLFLGGIGLFLPVWPTTPFVLGAAGCFAGSPRLSGWLKRSRIFREYIEHFQRGAPVTGATTAKSLCFLWGMLLLSCVLARRPLLWALLPAVGLAVTLHLLWIARRPRREKSGNGETGYDETEADHL